MSKHGVKAHIELPVFRTETALEAFLLIYWRPDYPKLLEPLHSSQTGLSAIINFHM